MPVFAQQPPPAGPPGAQPPGTEDGGNSTTLERVAQKTEPPRLYQVLMLNDDFTPMEFVVMVLQEYFRHDLDTATQIMLKIHHDGRGVCGVFTKDVAAIIGPMAAAGSGLYSVLAAQLRWWRGRCCCCAACCGLVSLPISSRVPS